MPGFLLVRPMLHWIIGHTGIADQIVVVGVTEAFSVTLKVAIARALVLSSPIIIYQGIACLVPGLFLHERRMRDVMLLPGAPSSL